MVSARRVLWVVVAASLLGCSGLRSTLEDAGVDGGAGPDAGAPDAGFDAGVDAGVDAGPCGGPCLPEPIAQQRVLPIDVEVTATHVLWLEYGTSNQGLEGQLNRMPKGATCPRYDGGCVEDLNTRLLGRFRLVTMTLSRTDFCWLEFYADQREVLCQSLLTGVERRVAVNQRLAWGLRGAGDELLWVTVGDRPFQRDGAVLRIDASATTATAPTPIASGRAQPYSVTADTLYYYWSEGGTGDGAGGVFRIPRAGGAAEPLAQGETGPDSLVVFDGLAWWATRTGEVKRTQAAGDAGVEVVSQGHFQPFALQVDARGVYWLVEGTGPNYLDGELWRAEPDGSAPRKLVSALPAASDLTLDGEYVYYSTQGTPAANYLDGVVWRLRRED